jgi:hypothetical protein
MHAARTVESRLRELEELLMRPEVRGSMERVAALLSDDFLEFGSSGQIFDKRQIIEALRNETPTERSLSDFGSTLLSDSIVLVTYRARRAGRPGEEPVHTLRSSIWRLNNGQWQMVFHQGTLTK